MKLRSIDTLGVEGLTVELRNGMGPYPMTWPEFDRLLSEVNECRPKEEKKMSEHVGVQVADMNRIQIWAVRDENHYRIVVTPDQARKIQHEINLAFEILARNKSEEKKPSTEQTYDTDYLRRINTQAETLCEHRKRIEALEQFNKELQARIIEPHTQRIDTLEAGHKITIERSNNAHSKINSLMAGLKIALNH